MERATGDRVEAIADSSDATVDRGDVKFGRGGATIGRGEARRLMGNLYIDRGELEIKSGELEIKSGEVVVESGGVKLIKCEECGDLIPFNSIVCPFCFYCSVDDGQYDHESSPYLMMLDLRSLVSEVIEMNKTKRLTLTSGLWRYFTRREIDPCRERLDAIDMLYYRAEELVWLRFGHKGVIAQALVIFEAYMLDELDERRAVVARVQRVGRCVAWVALLSVVTLTLIITIMIICL